MALLSASWDQPHIPISACHGDAVAVPVIGRSPGEASRIGVVRIY